MGDAPPQEGDGVGQITKTEHLMVLEKPSLLIFLFQLGFKSTSFAYCRQKIQVISAS